MSQIESLFEDKAIKRSNILLFSKENALEFIDECRKRNIVILGIDGFYLTEKTIQPSMDNSIDYSRRPFSESIYEEAIGFLKNSDDKLYFEIVHNDGY